MGEWNSKTKVEVTVTRNGKGELSDSTAPIRVQAEYIEYKENEDDEKQTRSHYGGMFLFAVEDDTAMFDSISHSKGENSFGILRCVAAAEHAVENVHGVESVESIEEVINIHLDKGRAAVEQDLTTQYDEESEPQLQSA